MEFYNEDELNYVNIIRLSKIEEHSKENEETNVALSSRISRHVLPFVRFSGVVTASRAKSSSLFEDADDGKLKYKNKDNIVTELT